MTTALLVITLYSLCLLSAARLPDYGIWKGTSKLFSATRGYTERPTVFGLITIHDGVIYPSNHTQPPGIRDIYAAADMKAPDAGDARMVYWIDRNFTAPLVRYGFALDNLRPGFHDIPATASDPHDVPALDMISQGLVDMTNGKLAPYDEPETDDDDMVDVLTSFFGPAVEALADVWVWGQRGEGGEGYHMHHVRMNQGHSGDLAEENGRLQDGGVVVKFHDHWEALFLAFPQQAVATDKTGQPDGILLGAAIEGDI